MFKRNLQVTE
jgi:hypothetical protein